MGRNLTSLNAGFFTQGGVASYEKQKLGDEQLEGSSAERNLAVLVKKPHPGVHQTQKNQPDKTGDYPTVLTTAVASPECCVQF